MAHPGNQFDLRIAVLWACFAVAVTAGSSLESSDGATSGADGARIPERRGMAPSAATVVQSLTAVVRHIGDDNPRLALDAADADSADMRGVSEEDGGEISALGWTVSFLGRHYNDEKDSTEFRYRAHDSCMHRDNCHPLHSFALGLGDLVHEEHVGGLLRAFSMKPGGSVLWDHPGAHDVRHEGDLTAARGASVVGFAWIEGLERGSSENYSVTFAGDISTASCSAILCAPAAGASGLPRVRCRSGILMGPLLRVAADGASVRDDTHTRRLRSDQPPPPRWASVGGRVEVAIAVGPLVFGGFGGGVRGVQVELVSAERPAEGSSATVWRATHTAADGSFSFDAVPTGIYTVLAQPAVGSHWRRVAVAPGGDACACSTSIHVVGDSVQATAGVQLCLSVSAEALAAFLLRPPADAAWTEASGIDPSIGAGRASSGLPPAEWLRLVRLSRRTAGAGVADGSKDAGAKHAVSRTQRELHDIIADALHGRTLQDVARSHLVASHMTKGRDRGDPDANSFRDGDGDADALVAAAESALVAEGEGEGEGEGGSGSDLWVLGRAVLAARLNAAAGRGLPHVHEEVQRVVIAFAEAVLDACRLTVPAATASARSIHSIHPIHSAGRMGERAQWEGGCADAHAGAFVGAGRRLCSIVNDGS
eukprot:Opistho-2@80070